MLPPSDSWGMLHQGDEIYCAFSQMQEEVFVVPIETVLERKHCILCKVPREGEKAIGNRCLHHQRSKEGSNVPGGACLGCCPCCKGSLQTKITTLSCNEMLIQLLLSQLLLPGLKTTAWVQVSPASSVGKNGDNSVWCFGAILDTYKVNCGEYNTLLSAERNDCSAVYSI